MLAEAFQLLYGIDERALTESHALRNGSRNQPGVCSSGNMPFKRRLHAQGLLPARGPSLQVCTVSICSALSWKHFLSQRQRCRFSEGSAASSEVSLALSLSLSRYSFLFLSSLAVSLFSLSRSLSLSLSFGPDCELELCSRWRCPICDLPLPPRQLAICELTRHAGLEFLAWSRLLEFLKSSRSQ